MGKRILLSCDKCGCKKEMSVGTGLMTNNPDIIASCLNEEEAKEWTQLYSQNKISFHQAKQKVFYCDHCRGLFCQLTVDATLTDGKEMTFGNKCEKCGNELEEISLETRHMVCPVCKEGDLSWKQAGLWD